MQNKSFVLLPLVALIIALLVFASACGKEEAAPQVLRANLAGEPATIDPTRASWAQERTVIMQVFEGLLGFNQDLTLKAIGAQEIPTTGNNGIPTDGNHSPAASVPRRFSRS